MILQELLTIFIFISTSLQSSVLQQTLYSYKNNTLYVRLTNNDLISIDFNQKFDTSSNGISASLESPPYLNSSLSIVDDKLYCFYQDGGNIGVSVFDGSAWDDLEVNNSFEYYNYSTYLTTLDDLQKVYIYGGISMSNESDITSRIIEYDIISNTFNDNISYSVSPTNFYGASNLLINYNTQLVIGGKSSNGWVGLKQLAMWQYESWSFKTMSNSDNINSRKFAQLLPIFNKQESKDILQNNNNNNLNIDGLILIGGELINDYSVPKILKLNVTDTSNGWSWSSLDDQLDIDLDNVMGSCVIYQTLITFTSALSNKQKRDNQYNFNLYDVANDVEEISTVDYTTKKSKSNKSAIIAVSVVVPIVVIILIAIGVWYYIKRQNSKDITNNFESFDIMDLYNNLSKKNSLKYRHDEVKVNNYDDNDNLSINSWRRKREEFEKSAARKKQPVRDLPALPVSQFQDQQVPLVVVVPQRQESLIKRSLSNFSKTFSLRQKPSVRTTTRISEENYYNEKSRSTLQFIDEDTQYKMMMNDSRSILSATTYYDEGDSPIKSPSSPLVNTNRFSDLTMLNNNNDSRVVVDDDEEDDNDIDVQVLVSSKRRSKLRVMNPDVDQDEDDEEPEKEQVDENQQFMNELFEIIDNEYDITNSDGTRKRIVSGESSKDV